MMNDAGLPLSKWQFFFHFCSSLGIDHPINPGRSITGFIFRGGGAPSLDDNDNDDDHDDDDESIQMSKT